MTGLVTPMARQAAVNRLRKCGWVVRVLADPVRARVRGTLRLIQPFSGMYTGMAGPQLAAAASARRRTAAIVSGWSAHDCLAADVPGLSGRGPVGRTSAAGLPARRRMRRLARHGGPAARWRLCLLRDGRPGAAACQGCLRGDR